MHPTPSPRRPPAPRRPVLVLALAAASATWVACDPGDGGEPAAAPGDSAAAASTPTPAAPPSTDIWLGRIEGAGPGLRVMGLRNVTDRPGYDNQPHFLPDGSGFLYTAADAGGGTDVWRWDLAAERSSRVTDTSPESEYSPTPLPGGGGFSAVRVEADSAQRLWRFGEDGSGAEVLLEAVEPVGYHAWIDEGTVALFVLGDPATLRVAELATGEARTVDRAIGRSMHPVPGQPGVVSFTRTGDEGEGGVHRYRHADGSIERIAPPVAPGLDFHAWTPDGTLLQASGSTIHAWDASSSEWRPVGSLEGAGVSRMAVSADGRWIAVVAQGGASR